MENMGNVVISFQFHLKIFLAETLITLCGEIEAIKPGGSKEIGKGMVELIKKATDILYDL